MQISIGSVEMVTPASTRDSLPAAPAGYGSGYLVYHPGAVLNVVAAVVFIIMLPLLSVMTLGLHGGLSLPIEVPLDIVAIAAMLAASVATLFFHELIHGLVLRHYKHRVSYGMDMGRLLAYAAAFGQFQARDHALTVALAPLVLITLTMLPLLAVPNHYVASVAFSVLLTNTPGAVGDLHLAWQLLRLPRQTLLYDIDPTRMLVFLPARW